MCSPRWLVIGCMLGALFGATACSSRSADKPAGEGKPPASARDAAAPATQPADNRYDDGALGALTFALSEGTPVARSHFTRGLLALHSFWYDEAARQFQSAIDADPTMNMAYWGVGMSHLKLLWGDDDLGAARGVISRMPNPDLLTPREQAWVMAAVELVRAGDVRTSRVRFAAAVEALHAEFPDDESATFLAIALLATTRPEDPDTVAVRKRAAALAAAVFERNPKHPGAAHYLIHAYDTAELAPLALGFARAYVKIAPAAFHARHMPAHIFSRLGMWPDAIASCQAAWDASVAAARREKLSASHHDFHSLSWIVEMSFELGKRKAADAALAIFADAVRGGLGRQPRALYATEVASYMKRTGEWARVDELLAPLDSPAVEEPVPVEQAPPAAPLSPVTPGNARTGAPASHCAPAPASSPLVLGEQLSILDARVRAASAQRDLPKTKRLLTELDAARTKLVPFLAAMQPKDVIAAMDAAHARRRQALLARAAGNDRKLVEILRQSAADTGEQIGGESNPSGFVGHEELADTLLALDQPKEAAVAYARVLQQHPGRAHAILGAARAAARSGDAHAAQVWYSQLMKQWSTADEGSAELAEARAAVAAPTK